MREFQVKKNIFGNMKNKKGGTRDFLNKMHERAKKILTRAGYAILIIKLTWP